MRNLHLFCQPLDERLRIRTSLIHRKFSVLLQLTRTVDFFSILSAPFDFLHPGKHVIRKFFINLRPRKYFNRVYQNTTQMLDSVFCHREKTFSQTIRPCPDYYEGLERAELTVNQNIECI